MGPRLRALGFRVLGLLSGLKVRAGFKGLVCRALRAYKV